MPKTKKNSKILLYGDIIGAYRSQNLIKFLLDFGYTVSLVCPNFYLGNHRKKQSFFEKLPREIHLIELFIKAAFVDVIYLLPLNIDLIKNAIFVSKLFNKMLVVEMYISLHDTFTKDRKLYKLKSKKAKKLMNKDILALTKPNYIIHTSKHEINCWENELKITIDKEKLFISPIFNELVLTHQRKIMIDGFLRICWWGTFIPLHGLDNILDAMKILNRKNIKFTCNLFGVDNEFFNIYAQKIKMSKLSSHVFLGNDLKFIDGSLPQYLVENCDLALGIFGNTDKAFNVIPNKLIESLSLGIPTLTMNSPALREFFEPEIDFWTCEPSPKSIAEAIIALISNTPTPVNWQQTRQKVLSIFSVTHYKKVVSEVLDRSY